MSTNNELISKGYNSLRGHWPLAILMSIIICLIGALPNVFGGKGFTSIFGFSIILTLLIQGPLTVGGYTFFLNLVNGYKASFENLLEGFRQNYLQIVVAFFIRSVLIILGFFLFIVPGIILALGLSQVTFIMAEDKNISGIDALKKSWAMMDGHKVKYFLLSLLFLLLIVAGFLALIVGIFFVIPVICSTSAQFYTELKQENKGNGVES